MTSSDAGASTSTAAVEDIGLVWIDARRAVIVRWQDEPVLEWVESGVPPRRKAVGSVRRGPARPSGGGRVGGHGTEERHRGQMRRFFADVAEKLADLDHVQVIGRGLPHKEFAELLARLAATTQDGLTITTESLARRPSERQLAARLRRLTGKSQPRREHGPYRPASVPALASGRPRPQGREDLANRRPRHLPEREAIDLEVEMMLAGDDPMW